MPRRLTRALAADSRSRSRSNCCSSASISATVARAASMCSRLLPVRISAIAASAPPLAAQADRPVQHGQLVVDVALQCVEPALLVGVVGGQVAQSLQLGVDASHGLGVGPE